MDVERVRELMASDQVRDRVVALGHTGDLDPEYRRALLRQAVTDRVPYVAAEAVRLLTENVANADDCRLLLERFEWCAGAGRKRDPGCHIRAAIASALGEADHAPAAEPLRRALETVQIEPVGTEMRDTGAHVRANAALALGRLRPTGIVRDLALLLFDRDGRLGAEPTPDHGSKVAVRSAAARALGMTCQPEAGTPLAVALAYPYGEAGEVLQDCMAALVALEDPGAAELLRPYLAGHVGPRMEHDDALTAYAALMAVRTGDPRAPAWVADAALRLNEGALDVALVALATARAPEVEAALRDLSDAPRSELRLALVGALARAPSDQNRRILELMAGDDPSTSVRDAAGRALTDS